MKTHISYSNSKHTELLARAEQAKAEYLAEFAKTGIFDGKALDLYNRWVGIERRITTMRDNGITEFLEPQDGE